MKDHYNDREQGIICLIVFIACIIWNYLKN